MWSILTLLLVPGLNAVQPTTYEMSDSRPPLWKVVQACRASRIVARSQPWNLLLFSLCLFFNCGQFACWFHLETASHRPVYISSRLLLHRRNLYRLLPGVYILIETQSPPIDNARLILPTLRVRGASQGDPFTFRDLGDNFPLHSTLGEDKLVQGPLVG